MTLSIAIAGVAGRMGQALVRAASADARFRVVGGTARAGSTTLGAPLGDGAMIGDDPRAASAGTQVWIDFTSPTATLAALDATQARAAIVGTTGFTPEQEAAIVAHGRRIAIVRSNNFSLGVTLLAALVRQAAEKLGAGWDIEITEAHHRRKLDAPSGTALLLGEAAASGRGKSLSQLRLAPHDGAGGERPQDGIGFSVIRGGGIVGAHDVRFAAEREIVTLSHQALDRAVFADGALAAALWAADKPPGFYSMNDVLGV
jgi:4-hydroxy-tetrahydrodipicolinate reductase